MSGSIFIILLSFFVGYLIGQYVEYGYLSERDRHAVKILEAIIFKNKESIDEMVKYYQKIYPKSELDKAIYKYLTKLKR